MAQANVDMPNLRQQAALRKLDLLVALTRLGELTAVLARAAGVGSIANSCFDIGIDTCAAPSCGPRWTGAKLLFVDLLACRQSGVIGIMISKLIFSTR